jgi:hypothetical protein
MYLSHCHALVNPRFPAELVFSLCGGFAELDGFPTFPLTLLQPCGDIHVPKHELSHSSQGRSMSVINCSSTVKPHIGMHTTIRRLCSTLMMLLSSRTICLLSSCGFRN